MDQNIIHEQFEVMNNEPFEIYNIDCGGDNPKLAPHYHDELELTYLFSHDVHYIDGHRLECHPGDLVIVNSKSVHMIEPIQTREDFGKPAAVVILVRERFVQTAFPEYYKVFFTNDDRRVTPEENELIKKISLYVSDWSSREFSRDDDEFGRVYLSGLILQLIYHICQHRAVERSSALDIRKSRNADQIRSIIQYVENHYADKISESDVADKFYLSSSYFSRFFKKNTGMSFREYLLTYRLEKSRNALANTDLGVLQVALENGFTDGRRLTLAFKKEFGILPSEYQKMMHEGASGE